MNKAEQSIKPKNLYVYSRESQRTNQLQRAISTLWPAVLLTMVMVAPWLVWKSYKEHEK